jgi:hypothetical protein
MQKKKKKLAGEILYLHANCIWHLLRYVGESTIIRTIGTCFAVGYTAGWV